MLTRSMCSVVSIILILELSVITCRQQTLISIDVKIVADCSTSQLLRTSFLAKRFDIVRINWILFGAAHGHFVGMSPTSHEHSTISALFKIVCYVIKILNSLTSLYSHFVLNLKKNNSLKDMPLKVNISKISPILWIMMSIFLIGLIYCNIY